MLLKKEVHSLGKSHSLEFLNLCITKCRLNQTPHLSTPCVCSKSKNRAQRTFSILNLQVYFRPHFTRPPNNEYAVQARHNRIKKHISHL